MTIPFSTAALDKFESQVNKGLVADECWVWQGSDNGRGYGVFSFDGETIQAHRFSHMAFVGSIPDGMFVCHKCDNPACVRPDHLYAGTNLENIRDRYVREQWASNLKANPERVLTVFVLRQQGLTQSRIASEVGLSQREVSDILRGVRWRHLGYYDSDRFKDVAAMRIERGPRRELTPDDVRRIFDMAEAGYGLRAIATATGFDRRGIQRILRGETHKGRA